MNDKPMGTCPVCQGTARVKAPPNSSVIWGYEKSTDTLPCRNCGGQTMGGVASGQVPLRPDGTPCKHEYSGYKAGNCYYIYTCNHCGYRYDIDSGD